MPIHTQEKDKKKKKTDIKTAASKNDFGRDEK